MWLTPTRVEELKEIGIEVIELFKSKDLSLEESEIVINVLISSLKGLKEGMKNEKDHE